MLIVEDKMRRRIETLLGKWGHNELAPWIRDSDSGLWHSECGVCGLKICLLKTGEFHAWRINGGRVVVRAGVLCPCTNKGFR